MKKEFKSEIKETIKKCVDMLKNAPYTNQPIERIKIFADFKDQIIVDYGVFDLNSYIQADLLVSFPYSHPDYDSLEYWISEDKSGMTLNEWDWNNFIESNGFSNYCDNIFEECKMKFMEWEFKQIENGEYNDN